MISFAVPKIYTIRAIWYFAHYHDFQRTLLLFLCLRYFSFVHQGKLKKHISIYRLSMSPSNSYLFAMESAPVLGSFAVQFEDHLHVARGSFRHGIICGHVQFFCDSSQEVYLALFHKNDYFLRYLQRNGNYN